MLEDVDFERYFGVAILESEKVGFGKELLDILEIQWRNPAE